MFSIVTFSTQLCIVVALMSTHPHSWTIFLQWRCRDVQEEKNEMTSDGWTCFHFLYMDKMENCMSRVTPLTNPVGNMAKNAPRPGFGVIIHVVCFPCALLLLSCFKDHADEGASLCGARGGVVRMILGGQSVGVRSRLETCDGVIQNSGGFLY